MAEKKAMLVYTDVEELDKAEKNIEKKYTEQALFLSAVVLVALRLLLSVKNFRQ